MRTSPSPTSAAGVTICTRRRTSAPICGQPLRGTAQSRQQVQKNSVPTGRLKGTIPRGRTNSSPSFWNTRASSAPRASAMPMRKWTKCTRSCRKIVPFGAALRRAARGRSHRRLFHRRDVRRYARYPRREGAARRRGRLSDGRAAVRARGVFLRGTLPSTRMDDAGDMGLRKSKLQISSLRGRRQVQRHAPPPHRSRFPSARDRLAPSHARAPCGRRTFPPTRVSRGMRSATVTRGYDWREDAPDAPDASYFAAFAEKLFREKMEMPLAAVYRGGTLVGEVVLHRFGYAAEAEIGVRLLPSTRAAGMPRRRSLRTWDMPLKSSNWERVEAKHFCPITCVRGVRCCSRA